MNFFLKYYSDHKEKGALGSTQFVSLTHAVIIPGVEKGYRQRIIHNFSINETLKMTDIDHRISEPAGEWFFKIYFVRFFFSTLRHDGSKEYKQHPDRQISTDGLLVVWGCG